MPVPAIQVPAKYDMNAYQGSTFVWASTFTYDDDPIDLTSAVVTMTIKGQRGKFAPIIWQGSTTTSGVAVGVAVNAVTITIPAVDTEDLPAGSLVYELDITEGVINYTYLTGRFVVNTEVDS